MIPLLLLASALLVAPGRDTARTRLARVGLIPPPPRAEPTASAGWLPRFSGVAGGLLAATVVGGVPGAALAAPIAVVIGLLCRKVVRRRSVHPPDPLLLAAGWDLLAACLRAGLPVAAAVRAVAGHLPAGPGAELHLVAQRLALGAGAQAAWQVPESSPLQVVARAARRSAHSGSGLAEAVERAAVEVRADARDSAAERGQRAAVLITGPLGLCFLPAFLALGVAPVVIGLASDLARAW